MPYLKHLLPILCLLLFTANRVVGSTQNVSDSLQRVLSRTVDPATRIQHLLNLKDLNEDNNRNLSFSIQLFREAAAVGDTYAMSVGVLPILNQYATYAEKEDSLRYYVRKLRELTPGTAEEGIDAYAELNIAFNRLNGQYNDEEHQKVAHEIRTWSLQPNSASNNIGHQIKALTAKGYALAIISGSFKDQIPLWQQAYQQVDQLASYETRMHFSILIYFMLSTAYCEAGDYAQLARLTEDYLARLEQNNSKAKASNRRPYFYIDNAYSVPYQQLIRGALDAGLPQQAQRHFDEFRRKMLSAEGYQLARNKGYLYEMGYLWQQAKGDYTQSLRYCDSLINFINREQKLRITPNLLSQVYRDHSAILAQTGNYRKAAASYDRTFHLLDSLHRVEQKQRLETIRHSNEMDKLQLAETRSVIRNHLAAFVSIVIIVLLLIGTGLYYFRALLRNKRLQAEILHQSRKAQESERMKSAFVNSICSCIQRPYKQLDEATARLLNGELTKTEQHAYLGQIRVNIEQLLSTLDNILEAANLDSLTESLKLTPIDVSSLCRSELLATTLKHTDKSVEYIMHGDASPRLAMTHASYFSFVIRAMLDNAAKYTLRGEITLCCEPDGNGNICISVSDTGCGIPPSRRDTIFRSNSNTSADQGGMSLALCRAIALQLHGQITLDETYGPGTRFIFLVPAVL